MPCYDGRENIVASSLAEEARRTREEHYREFEHNSPVAELLCRCCKALENTGSNMLRDPELSRWWEAHKKRDQRRRRRK